jgi:hypothetical protein
MANKPNEVWHVGNGSDAPRSKRLLLIVSAAGEPPDALLMHDCDVIVGYRDDRGFFPITAPGATESGAELKVRYWREIPSIPRGVKIRTPLD